MMTRSRPLHDILQYPSPVPKIALQESKPTSRVLTSAQNMKQLEEKQRVKEEKLRLKEERQKIRQEKKERKKLNSMCSRSPLNLH